MLSLGHFFAPFCVSYTNIHFVEPLIFSMVLIQADNAPRRNVGSFESMMWDCFLSIDIHEASAIGDIMIHVVLPYFGTLLFFLTFFIIFA